MIADVIIAGGGLAGLTSAIHLSKSGLKVLIIEKSAFPKHKVCGEYLSREVLPYLEWLGIDLLAQKPALISRVQISTPGGKSIETLLPLGGIGISRFSLDHLLLEKALSQGCVLLQDTVLGIKQQDAGFEVSTVANGTFYARNALGAFGKRSNLDVELNRSFRNMASGWLGVKCHYKADFPDDLVAVHHFKGGYCGVSQVENGVVNICYLATYADFKRFKNIHAFQENVLNLNPHLNRILKSCEPLFDEPLSIGQVSFAGKEKVESGILMLGDAAGLIHPFCGNGMAIAIHTAKIASELISEQLHSGLTIPELNRRYIRLWDQNFSARIRISKIWASVIRHELASDLLLLSLTRLPFILPQLIKQTHGRLMSIPSAC